MSLTLDIHKSFGDFSLNISLNAKDEIIGLLGASGSGKSMTLKCIAGIVKPDFGNIRVNDEVFYDSEKNIFIDSRYRKVGMLFQNYALFPSMTVFENIYSCTIGTKEERKKKTSHLLKKFEIEDIADLNAKKLSGGQQQRTAFARMMSIDPNIILLDEPFSALDTSLKWRMENNIYEYLRDFNGTTVLVTHDKDEAYRLCDKIAIIDSGEVVEIDTKENIFRAPKTIACAKILGYKNIFDNFNISTLNYEGYDAVLFKENKFSIDILENAIPFEGKIKRVIKEKENISIIFDDSKFSNTVACFSNEYDSYFKENEIVKLYYKSDDIVKLNKKI